MLVDIHCMFKLRLVVPGFDEIYSFRVNAKEMVVVTGLLKFSSFIFSIPLAAIPFR